MRGTIYTLAIAVLLGLPLHAQDGEKRITPIAVTQRVALVVGNASYQHQGQIPQAVNDAQDMAAQLRALHFDVRVITDARVDDLDIALSAFYRSIRPGSLAVFYYSGHGGSVGEENYLLPIEFEQQLDEDGVERRAIRMSKIRDRMESSGADVRLLVFDACRTENLVATKESTTGLYEMQGHRQGTLIAYASAAGMPSRYDPSARNSFYTAQLLEHLKNPAADLEALLQQTEDSVYSASGKRQTPYIYGHIFEGRLYLAGDPQPPAPEPNPSPRPSPRVSAEGGESTLVVNCDLDCTWKLDGEERGKIYPGGAGRALVQPGDHFVEVFSADGRDRTAQPVTGVAGQSKMISVALKPIRDARVLAAEAAFRRGWSFANQQNYSSAVREYQQACSGGSMGACVNLGYMFDMGHGMPRDASKAVSLYKQACDGGDMTGCKNLGYMYDESRDGLQDYGKAVALYKQACDGGELGGCVYLGSMYDDGHGVPQDYGKAVALYRQACDGGNLDGCTDLGTMYSAAGGVLQDYGKAVVLYKQACDGGEMMGCKNLGVMYQYGRGVTADKAQARALYDKACTGGEKKGCDALKSLDGP